MENDYSTMLRQFLVLFDRIYIFSENLGAILGTCIFKKILKCNFLTPFFCAYLARRFLKNVSIVGIPMSWSEIYYMFFAILYNLYDIS